MQYISAALFFVLTLLYIVLAVWDRASDVERAAKDEAEHADFLAKQNLKAAQSKNYFADKLQRGKRQAESSYKGFKQATAVLSGFQAASKEGAGRFKEEAEHSRLMETPDQPYLNFITTP